MFPLNEKNDQYKVEARIVPLESTLPHFFISQFPVYNRV